MPVKGLLPNTGQSIETAAAQLPRDILNITLLNITVEYDNKEETLACNSLTNKEKNSLLRQILHRFDSRAANLACNRRLIEQGKKSGLSSRLLLANAEQGVTTHSQKLSTT
jgi:hypothetical protein